MGVQAVAKVQSIGVQCDETPRRERGDTISVPFMKEFEMTVEKTMKRILKQVKSHNNVVTLSASQVETAAASLAKILKNTKCQASCVKCPRDTHHLSKSQNKTNDLKFLDVTSQTSPVQVVDSVPSDDLSSAPCNLQMLPSKDKILSAHSNDSIEIVSCASSISSIHIMPSEDELVVEEPETSAMNEASTDMPLLRPSVSAGSQNLPSPPKNTSALEQHQNQTSSEVLSSLQSMLQRNVTCTENR